ncbi:MAG: poly-beta-1,6 N-acetyl-D-glucosamine export porin PgaA [Pseudomonadota bacterium]
MFKHVISSIIFILVLAFFYHEMSNELSYSPQKVTQLREQAVQWAKDGDYERALSQLEILYDAVPNNQSVVGDYLLVLIQSGQADKALSLAKQKDFNTIPLNIFEELFIAALQNNQLEFARSLAEYQIKSSENPSEVAINRAASLSEFGYDQEALNLLAYAKPYAEPDDLSLEVMRLVILSKIDPLLAQQEAEVLFNQEGVNQIQAWEVYRDYWVQQGQAGNLEQAIAQLEKYQNQAPEELNFAQDLLVLHAWNQDYEKSEGIYYDLPNKQELPEYVRAAAAQTLYNRGRLTEARDIYQDLHAEFPDNNEYKKGLAKVYVELRQPEDAILLLQSSDGEMDSNTLIILGLAQQQLGSHEQALDALSKAIKSNNQKDDNAYYAWADSLEQLAGEKGTSSVWPRYSVPLAYAPDTVKDRVQNLISKKTIRSTSSQRNKDPISGFNVRELRREAAVARQNGNYKQAIRLYEYGLRRFPNDRELSLGLALTYTDTGNKNRAESIFNKLFKRYPTDKEILDGGVYFAQRFNEGQLQTKLLRDLISITSGKEQQSYIDTWLAFVDDDNNFADDQSKREELNKLRYLRNNEISLALAKNYFKDDRCNDAKQVLSVLSNNDASEAQLESAGFMLRSCGYSKLALSLYKEGLDRFSDNYVFVTGAILALTDLQRYPEAEKLADQYAMQFDHEPEFILAKAYLHFSQNDYQKSLAYYKQVLDQNPEHQEAYIGWVLSMAQLEQAEDAFTFAQQKPNYFTNEHWKRLYELRSAQLVRNAELAPLSERVPMANKALVSLDEQLEFLDTNYPDDKASYTNASLNKVRALTLADQASEAVKVYESLSLSKEEVPAWGLPIAAEAYLKNRQPEEAVELANYAAAQYQKDLNILSIIFFAYLDLEDYKNAGQTLDQMNMIIEGQEVTNGRAHWVARLDAMFEAYQNRLGLAEKLLKDLKQQAPNDPEIDMNLATIYRWRGWANKSLETLDEIPEGSVDNVALEAIKANALLDQHSYTRAEDIINTLDENYEFHPDVKTLDERWRIHNLRQYTADVIFGESSGNTFGNEELLFEQRLFSSPIKNHYRVYGRHRYNYAEFPEGNGYLNRVGIGGEYRSKFLDATAEFNVSTRDSSNPGVSLSGIWKLDDYLSFSADVQTYSDLTPLRAINDDIEASSLVLGANYRWNENRFARVNVGYLDFDDGNNREFVYIKHQHGLYQSAYHRFSLSEEFYASKNDDIDAIYYNPESDYSFRLAGIYDGLIWRRYEREWTHRLTIGVGNYKQKSESNAGIWDLEYLQRWQLSPTFEIRYGYLHRRRTFDGEGESFNAGIANLNWRF